MLSKINEILSIGFMTDWLAFVYRGITDRLPQTKQENCVSGFHGSMTQNCSKDFPCFPYLGSSNL